MSHEPFIRIAITSPSYYPHEVTRIIGLLKNNEVDFIHLRKPEWSEKELANMIGEIPEEWHPRLKIHDHFSLVRNFNLGGVHLNSRNPSPPQAPVKISRSVHSLEEIANLEAPEWAACSMDDIFSPETEQHPPIRHYEYVTLSPIFDSISKHGYLSQFNLEAIKSKIIGKRVIALGGVTPDKFEVLKKNGFYGAALLGYFFP